MPLQSPEDSPGLAARLWVQSRLPGELMTADAQPTSTDLAIADRRAEARQKGYVGESCPDCGNFTFVRNGACLKCGACGSTTGCS